MAGVWLAERGLYAHGDGHHHRAHAHDHDATTHTRHHSHDTGDGHVPQSPDADAPRPCGGDEHHCCMDHGGQSDAAHFTLPPRETRRLSELDRIATDVDVAAGVAFAPEAWTPPRAPPRGPASQDTLPHLRTIVLLN